MPATLGSLAVAAGLHGLYDFVVILNANFALPIAALLILTLWVWRLKVLRAMHKAASQDR